MTKTKKALIISLSAIVLLCSIFICVSYFIFDRSLSATITEMGIASGKTDDIFENEEDFAQYFTSLKNKQFSEEPYEIPEKLKLTSSAEYKEKHGMQVFFIEKDKLNKSDSVVFYFYGGAFIGGITEEHWKFIDQIAEETGLPVIVPLYPTLPKYTSADANESLIKLYKDIAKKKNIENIYFVGDFSGGNLALSLAKELRDHKVTQPGKLVLISPWLDLAMKNKDIADYEKKDKVLGVYGLKKLGKLWSGKKALTNPTVSPVYGSNEGLGEITIYASGSEILYPDISLYSETLTKEGIKHNLNIAENLSHGYVLLNTKEGKQARQEICDIIAN